ncbi:MAG TPA: glycoside hydrolase family 3 N-terminal domain-containing protein [Vitreimonas sp.]|nr:glycoside hydrolase family 3 N-terminal domain-containing protein [Vitreimonas sp.]
MPSKNILLLIAFLCLLVGLLSYNYYYQPFAYLGELSSQLNLPSPSPSAPVTKQSSPALNEYLSALSTRQKIAHLLSVPVTLSTTEPASTSGSLALKQAWIKQEGPGMVLLFGEKISQPLVTAFTTQINSGETNAAQVLARPLVAVDHEGGSVQRLSGQGFTALASWQELCALPETTMQERLQLSAQELKAAGVNVVLAPMVDVGVTPHPVLKSRLCSDDVETTKQRAQLFIDAFTGEGVLPTLKHFPGIGRTSKDLHLQFDQITFNEQETALFGNLLENNSALAVMTTHVGLTEVTGSQPCSLDPQCVGELKKAYPQALIVTDALEMKAAQSATTAAEVKNLSQISIAAVTAGNDVLVYGPGVSTAQLDAIITELESEYQRNLRFREQVELSNKKILHFKEQYHRQ